MIKHIFIGTSPCLLLIPICIALLGASVSTFFHVTFNADAFNCAHTNACAGVKAVHSLSLDNPDSGYYDGKKRAIKDCGEGDRGGSCPDGTDGTPYCSGYTSGYDNEMEGLLASHLCTTS